MSKQKSAEKLAGFNGAADQIESLTKGIPETRDRAGQGGTGRDGAGRTQKYILAADFKCPSKNQLKNWSGLMGQQIKLT